MAEDVIYLNNCRGRDHESLFGTGAFYDLNTRGKQAKLATDLPVGQECVVAGKPEDGRIPFRWYSLEAEVEMPEAGTSAPTYRVFFGPLIATEVLAQNRARAMKRYAHFFNVNGHFKQQSVISASLAGNHRVRASRAGVTLFPDEIDLRSRPLMEGAVRQVLVNAYERSADARTQCIRHYGQECVVCGFSFAATYGAMAAGFIHVHHLKPLAEIGVEYEVEPINDLRPVCPNCHAIIHLGGELRSIEEVKALLAAAPARLDESRAVQTRRSR